MVTVGNYLKSEREAKNMSLSDASQLTCITEYYLGHIEKDEFDKLPQGPYIKGYLTLYSRSIGTDVDKVLDLYESLNLRDKKIDAFQLKRPRQDSPPTPHPENATDVLEEPQPDASAASPEKAASPPRAPIAPALKAGALGLARQFVLMTAKAARRTAASTTRGIQWLGAAGQLFFQRLEAASRKVFQRLGVTGRQFFQRLGVAGRQFFKWLGVAGRQFFHWRGAVGKQVKAKVEVLSANSRKWFDKAFTRVKSRQFLRGCLYLFSAAVGACILVLAGFGFYHLFIYEKPPTLSAARQPLPVPAAASPAAREAEKTPVSSKTDETRSPDSQHRESNEAVDPAGNTRVTADKTPAPPSASTSRADSGRKTAAAGSTAAPAAPAPGVKVLKASVCSGIKNRMPVGVDNVFSNKTERVYVWSQIQADRAPNRIRHIYYLNGQVMNDVALNVGSAHWRTWSYLTTSNGRQRGQWRVDITAADGRVLRRLFFKIS